MTADAVSSSRFLLRTFGIAIDRYLGHVASMGSGSTETRRRYFAVLNELADSVDGKLTDEVTTEDCRAFLDRTRIGRGTSAPRWRCTPASPGDFSRSSWARE